MGKLLPCQQYPALYMLKERPKAEIPLHSTDDFSPQTFEEYAVGGVIRLLEDQLQLELKDAVIDTKQIIT